MAEDIIVFASIEFTVTEILYLFELSSCGVCLLETKTWPAFKMHAAFQSNMLMLLSELFLQNFPFLFLLISSVIIALGSWVSFSYH